MNIDKAAEVLRDALAACCDVRRCQPNPGWESWPDFKKARTALRTILDENAKLREERDEAQAMLQGDEAWAGWFLTRQALAQALARQVSGVPDYQAQQLAGRDDV